MESPNVKGLMANFPPETNAYLAICPGPIIGAFLPVVGGPAGEPAAAPPTVTGSLGGFTVMKDNVMSSEIIVPMDLVLSIKDAILGSMMMGLPGGPGGPGGPPRRPAMPPPGAGLAPAPAPAAPAPAPPAK